MKTSKSIWWAALIAVPLVTWPVSNAAEKKDKPEKKQSPTRQAQPQRVQPKAQPQERVHPQQAERRPAPPISQNRVQPKPERNQPDKVSDRPTQPQQPEKGQARQDRSSPPNSKAERNVPVAPQPKKDKEKENPLQVHARQPSSTVTPERTQLLRPTPPPYKLTDVKKSGGTVERVSPSNKVRERTIVEKKTGNQRTQQVGVTGRVEVEEVKRKDGTRQVTQYDLGREKKLQVVRKDGCVETTDVQYNRNGQQRVRETIVCDTRGKPVSKTVVVKPTLVIRNTTIVHNTTVVRNYSPCRYGFVYRPVVYRPLFYASWYDPYWYSPAGVAIYRPFRYSWGWYHEPWFRCHVYYWEPYPVYASPCFWITDWLVAGYIADRYAAAASAAQVREEVRLAREEAEKARIAAEQARDAAEIAEARAAQAAAEARAERAEARAARAELEEARAKELAGKPNPNATAIDKETKDALKDQVEQTIAEKKQFAEQSANGGNPVPTDVTVSLANPKYIFPVSKTISVIRAEDSKPAGVLTAGDLLRTEPGQEQTLADATENTPITMRVITSKGDDDSVPAGTLVAIPLRELQEFDNEFRAKIDLGLAEASNSKELFKKEAVN
jgi:hypothetical protein